MSDLIGFFSKNINTVSNNNIFVTCLIELLEDDFDGDFQITRRGLLEYIKKAKWNAEILSKNPEIKGETVKHEHEPVSLASMAWVGLTNEELFGLTDEMYNFARHIEAKLKEKNT